MPSPQRIPQPVPDRYGTVPAVDVAAIAETVGVGGHLFGDVTGPSGAAAHRTVRRDVNATLAGLDATTRDGVVLRRGHKAEARRLTVAYTHMAANILRLHPGVTVTNRPGGWYDADLVGALRSGFTPYALHDFHIPHLMGGQFRVACRVDLAGGPTVTVGCYFTHHPDDLHGAVEGRPNNADAMDAKVAHLASLIAVMPSPGTTTGP